jgi:uncharacterized repeat protein (TIGR03803 family)
MTGRSSAILLEFFTCCLIAIPPASAQTFHVLHTFTGKDGAYPEGVLVRDASGNLYGTAAFGGTKNCGVEQHCGTAFMLNKNGKLVGSYSFDGPDGMKPSAGLFRDAAGNFYGTTQSGGDNESSCGTSGCGIVFKLSPRGKETVLHKFTQPQTGPLPSQSWSRMQEGTCTERPNSGAPGPLVLYSR